MPLFLVKFKSCFNEAGRPYYGWAGDAYIAAVVTAPSAERAVAMMVTETTDEAGFHDEPEDYVAEPLEPAEGEAFHLLCYGSY